MAEENKVKKGTKNTTTTKKTTKSPTTKTEIAKIETEVTKPVDPKSKDKTKHSWLWVLVAIIVVIGILMVIFRRQIVVATVNGQPIFWYQYVQNLEKQGGSEVLDQMVLEKLIAAEAVKQGVSVSSEEIDKEIESIRDKMNGQKLVLEEMLVQQSMTMDSLRNQIKLQKLVTALAAKEVTVSDQEVTEYMEKNKATLPTGKDMPENFNQLVKEKLLQTKQQDAVQTYLDNLKQSAQIQNW